MKGKTALTAAERIRDHRKKRLNDGWKQVNVWLTPEALLSLQERQQRAEVRGEKRTQSEIICEALLRVN